MRARTQLRGCRAAGCGARPARLAREPDARGAAALAANLVADYEGSVPTSVSVILNSHGFSDLLEQMSFLRRVGRQDAQIVGTRTAAMPVSKEGEPSGERSSSATAYSPTRSWPSATRSPRCRPRCRQQLSAIGARTHDSSQLCDRQRPAQQPAGKARGRGRRAPRAPRRRQSCDADRQRPGRRDRAQHRRHGPAAPGRARGRRQGDRGRQRDRNAAVHLGRRPRVLPGQRLRLLGLGQLRARRRRAASARRWTPPASRAGASRARASGSRSTPTPTTSSWSSPAGALTRSPWPRAAPAGRTHATSGPSTMVLRHPPGL